MQIFLSFNGGGSPPPPEVFMHGYIAMAVVLFVLAFTRIVWLSALVGAIAATIIHFQVWIHAKGEFSFIAAVGLSPLSAIAGVIAGGVVAAIGKRFLLKKCHEGKDTNSD